MFPCFRAGADYLINSRERVAGRSRGSYRSASSTPSLCTFPSTSAPGGACLSTGFAQGCRAGSTAGVGFPEFTRFFNHSHLWKLQHSCVKFPMAVGTQQDAFIDFFFHPLPTPRITLVGYPEVFLRRVEVVKFQS